MKINIDCGNKSRLATPFGEAPFLDDSEKGKKDTDDRSEKCTPILFKMLLYQN